MKVGYLGPEGTFSEEAGKDYMRKIEKTAELIPYPTFHDVLYAADKKEIDEAIVPIENSIEGTIGIVTDMLVKDVDLLIWSESVINVNNNLISRKGVKLSDITDIISHPQPIEQCKDFLRAKLKHAKIHLAYSTSDAVRQVAESFGEKFNVKIKNKEGIFAAIGTASSARLYGLEIIESSINARHNQTRFAVLNKKRHPKTGDDKTSIVFSIAKDKPGGLYNILSEFADRSINLTKIESRPGKKVLGDYYFFVDLAGHIDDSPVGDALDNIKKKTAFFKFLGSYPRFQK